MSSVQQLTLSDASLISIIKPWSLSVIPENGCRKGCNEIIQTVNANLVRALRKPVGSFLE